MSDDPQTKGKWTPLLNFRNVLVHATLLPNGKVLHWGRREDPTKDPRKDAEINNLDEQFTNSFLWTPALYPAQPINGQLGTSDTIANQPKYIPFGKDALDTVNLFCSGHSFLSSGDVFVAGGHIEDSRGANSACVFRWEHNTWETKAKMNRGRWYPSVLTLPDGRMLTVSGSDETKNNNPVAEIYDSNNDSWSEVASFQPIDLYPRIHLNPKNGQVFTAGPRPDSWFLQLKEGQGTAMDPVIESNNPGGIFGRWNNANTSRREGSRDYCPSVMYAPGKVMYIGGGNGDGGPTKITEFIDLTQDSPKWDTKTVNMNTERRQFNATILPDGTVLVTGGSRIAGFNEPKSPALTAELMNPSVEPKQWIEMAKEEKSRCYHSIALLLPDGRVLSAGGGEYGGVKADECHTDGQLYEPPYLHKGSVRPTIVSVPSGIEYNRDFDINLGTNVKITKVSWMGLGSVTHCRNMSQSYMTLKIKKQDGTKLSVAAPENPNFSPPGWYMLFALDEANVPSEAKFVSIPPQPTPTLTGQSILSARMVDPSPQIQPTLEKRDVEIASAQTRLAVVVGITPLCPYGLGACWGSAYKGLQEVKDIKIVRPMPHHDDSVAFVYLQQDILPDIDVWRREFEGVVNKSYDMRGIEMTVSGTVTKTKAGINEHLTLAGTSTRPELILAPFQASSQLKWDMQISAAKPITNAEAGAYQELVTTVSDHTAGVEVQVTGTLQKHDADKFSLDVREFKVLDVATS